MDILEKILDLKTEPPADIVILQNLTGDEYFRLFDYINNKIILKTHPRLSALLQNLEERRKNKWEKHLSAAEGPKKLN